MNKKYKSGKKNGKKNRAKKFNQWIFFLLLAMSYAAHKKETTTAAKINTTNTFMIVYIKILVITKLT